MYLFRAMLNDQITLSSHDRYYKTKIDCLNEIYSHVVKTYPLMDEKIIYSFTDDINIAKRILNKHSDFYSSIGVINIDVDDKNNIIFGNGINAIYPIFEPKHWVELAALRKINNTSITNLNYDTSPKTTLAATLIPSRWGVLSLAKKNREYAVVCDKLRPEILTESDFIKEEYIDNETKNITICSDKSLINSISETLITEIESFNIEKARKNYMINQLKKDA